jgi:hypothetical protein
VRLVARPQRVQLKRQSGKLNKKNCCLIADFVFREADWVLRLPETLACDRLEQRIMLTELGIAGVALGTLIACLADQYPRHRQSMQTFAGVLLITGIALLGRLLPTTLIGP